MQDVPNSQANYVCERRNISLPPQQNVRDARLRVKPCIPFCHCIYLCNNHHRTKPVNEIDKTANVTHPNLWLVRCGNSGSETDACVAANVIAVRFPPVNDLQQTDIDVLAFTNEIHPGDLVLSPNKARNRYFLGTITGDYVQDENNTTTGLNHIRAVEWTNYLEWDVIPLEYKNIKYYRRIVLAIQNTTLQNACIEALQTPLTKNDLLMTGAKKTTPTKRRTTTKTTTTRPAKIDPAKQERLCTSCGLKKHLRQFSGSSVFCVDCE